MTSVLVLAKVIVFVLVMYLVETLIGSRNDFVRFCESLLSSVVAGSRDLVKLTCCRTDDDDVKETDPRFVGVVEIMFVDSSDKVGVAFIELF